jgi:hypothetical protein
MLPLSIKSWASCLSASILSGVSSGPASRNVAVMPLSRCYRKHEFKVKEQNGVSSPYAQPVLALGVPQALDGKTGNLDWTEEKIEVMYPRKLFSKHDLHGNLLRSTRYLGCFVRFRGPSS